MMYLIDLTCWVFSFNWLNAFHSVPRHLPVEVDDATFIFRDAYQNTIHSKLVMLNAIKTKSPSLVVQYGCTTYSYGAINGELRLILY